MKNTKRIIATVLTAVMMISMLPSSVFAAELDAYDVVEPAVEAVSVPAEEQEIESTVEDISVEDAEEVQGSSEEIETVDAADPEAADVIEDTEAPVVGAENFPAQDFEGKTDSVTVKVHAPEGALPAGTELKVEEVKKEDVENLVSEGTEDFVAVDISFHVDGKEEDFEPLAAVEVEFVLEKDVLPQTENYDVIHVAVDEKGEETPEVIEEKNIIDEFTTEGGKISQKDFSVFIIAAAGASSSADTDDERAVAIYKFYNGENELTAYEQAVKAGEELVEPATPEVAEGKTFDGWYEGETKVAFGTLTEVVSGDHRVEARFVDAVHVRFYDYDNETVICTKVGAPGASVGTTDIEATSNVTGKVFVGWSQNPNAATAEVGETVNPSADMNLYPVYANGHRLIFDPNDDDGAGTYATHTPTQYIDPSEVTEEPTTVPTRRGFTFAGWYADPECTTEFTFGQSISEDTTVYAKWNGAASTYTVVVWFQKASDLKTYTDAEKTYDYHTASNPISANVGDKVGAGQYANLSERGFVLNSNKTEKDVVVKADGTTVVNVYYDRVLITYRFRSRLGFGYNNLTMSGLYGQNLDLYKYDSGNLAGETYSWPSGNWDYDGGSLTYTGSFNFWSGTSQTQQFTGTVVETGDYRVINYIEQDDGTYREVSRAWDWILVGGFEFQWKFFGYTPTRYYIDRPLLPDLEGSCAEGDTVTLALGQTLHVYHSKRYYTITFKTVDGTVLRGPDSYKHGTSLSRYANYEVEPTEDYLEFTGWYEDTTLTKKVDFNNMKMPTNDFVVYAGFKPINHKVTIDPNGGKFADESTEVKVVQVPHGSNVPEDELQVTRDGAYEFKGWTVDEEAGDTWTNDVVTADGLVLVANWTYTGSIKINYYNGTRMVAESPRWYRDGAEAEITAPIQIEEGKSFVGWTEKDSDVVYYPGSMYTVDGTKADANGKIKLYAKFIDVPTPVYTSITFNANRANSSAEATVVRGAGTPGETYEWTDIARNRAIDLGEVTATAPGFNFLGWAKDPNATEAWYGVDDNKPVAADEIGTNILYAVYEKQYFYVYCPSIKNTKRFEMPTTAGGTFNICDVVDKEGYIYGGYYHYEGNEKGEAYKDEPGTAMTPVADTTYYLKEVPNGYLTSRIYRTYRKKDPKLLRGMWLLTSVDEEAYTDYGFIVEVSTGEKAEMSVKSGSALLAKKIEVTNTDTGNVDATIVPANIYAGSKDKDASVAIANATSYLNKDGMGNGITITSYFVTPDNVKVTGINARKYTSSDLKNDSLIFEDKAGTYTCTALNKVGVSRVLSSRKTFTIGTSEENTTITVTKVDNGKKVAQTVKKGDNSGKITWAGKTNYVFAGWYEDASYSKVADFSNVKQDMTVYAKYVKASTVKLSFAKKAVKAGEVTLKATLKFSNQPDIADTAVKCTYNDKVYTVEFTGVKRSSAMDTYTGTVKIDGLENKSAFTAVVSYTTPDGTNVKMSSRTCTYNAGTVTVK